MKTISLYSVLSENYTCSGSGIKSPEGAILGFLDPWTKRLVLCKLGIMEKLMDIGLILFANKKLTDGIEKL